MNEFRKNISKIKKNKLKKEQVVSLEEYRSLLVFKQSISVLIVNSDEYSRKSLKRILESKNFLVSEASDGIELSKALESQTIQIILMDTDLPWISGLDLCEMIKKNNKYSYIPIILITSEFSENEKSKALSFKSCSYLARPLDQENLFKIINSEIHFFSKKKKD